MTIAPTRKATRATATVWESERHTIDGHPRLLAQIVDQKSAWGIHLGPWADHGSKWEVFIDPGGVNNLGERILNRRRTVTPERRVLVIHYGVRRFVVCWHRSKLSDS